MREITKIVYYCDHCAKHGLRRVAMAKHEAGCTMNPVRVCRWRIDGHSDGTRQMDMRRLAEGLDARAVLVPLSADPAAREVKLFTKDDIDWLRDEVDGCPACMLAALRQSGVTDFHFDADSNLIFDYGDEVERLRVEERRQDDAW